MPESDFGLGVVHLWPKEQGEGEGGQRAICEHS